jgi:hypothetical protein
MTNLEILKELCEKTKFTKTINHVVSLQKKLLKRGQNIDIPCDTIISENLAVLKQARTISHSSLSERLAKLITVRASLDSVKQEQYEDYHRMRDDLDKRKADLDIREAQLDTRCVKLNVMCDEIAESKAMLNGRFEELDKRNRELFNKEAGLVVREKVLSRNNKELLEEKKKIAEIHEILGQSLKKYSQPQPLPELQAPQDEPPEYFIDNIFTLDVMENPVVAEDGFTYEKVSIEKWFRDKRTSPATGAALSSTHLIPNHSLKSQINQWKEKKARNLAVAKK